MRRTIRVIVIALLAISVFIGVFTIMRPSAIKERTDLDNIYKINTDSSEFQIIYSLTKNHYNHLRKTEVKVNNAWKLYIISGDTAKRIADERSILGFTMPATHVVVVLDTGYGDWRLILSHELVHVLQAEQDRIGTETNLQIEYEAELLSRFVFSTVMKSMSDDSSKIMQELSKTELVQAVLLLQYIPQHGE